MSSNNPLTVEVTRGDMVESRHMGACVVVDADGGILHAWGDQDRVVYPRSAIKPLQTLVLIETGAADAYQLTDAELALASASHGATSEHVDGIGAWLKRIGLGPEDLECGGHDPTDADAAKALFKARCSGVPKVAIGSLTRIDGNTIYLKVSRIVDPRVPAGDKKKTDSP